MGANDGPPSDPGKPGDDDWFKQAAARWERQKAEDKLRAEPVTEPPRAVTEARPEEAAAVREVEDDLRQLAQAEAAAVEQRKVEPSALVIAPLEDVAFSVPRVRRSRGWLAAAGGLALVAGAVVLWPRSLPVPPATAAPAIVAAAPAAPAATAPVVPPTAPAPPAAAPAKTPVPAKAAPATIATKKRHRVTDKHRAKKKSRRQG